MKIFNWADQLLVDIGVNTTVSMYINLLINIIILIIVAYIIDYIFKKILIICLAIVARPKQNQLLMIF